MLPGDLKVAILYVRDMAKRLKVQANAARTLSLSYIQHYVFVHNAAVAGRGGRGNAASQGTAGAFQIMFY